MLLAGLIFFVVGGLCIVILYIFQTELKDAIRWIRWAETWVTKLVVGDDYTVAPEAGSYTLKQWRTFLHDTPGDKFPKEFIVYFSEAIVPPLRPYMAGIVGVMAIIIMFFGPGAQYRRSLNLETLMREQARSFPSIYPFIKFNPLKMPFRPPGQPVISPLPLFSEALSPEEWLAFNEVPVQGNNIEPNKAWEAMVKQLGKRWEGPLKLPLHAQGLYAAFALKHVRKRKDSEALLDEMSMCWSPEKGFRPSAKLKSKIRSVIKDPKTGGKIREYADKHAFETTALLRCLNRAREEGGVLAPAQFLWLRGQDRTLWYPLNNLGRKSYHAEAAGALVHYTNELIAGQKIPTPRFDGIIKGLEEYLKTGITLPPLEKSGRKSA